jgi:hypothetical protein
MTFAAPSPLSDESRTDNAVARTFRGIPVSYHVSYTLYVHMRDDDSNRESNTFVPLRKEE